MIHVSIQSSIHPFFLPLNLLSAHSGSMLLQGGYPKAAFPNNTLSGVPRPDEIQCIVPPACTGSALGSPTSWTCLESFQEASWTIGMTMIYNFYGG